MGIHHPEHVFGQVPAQLSGGMLQRVMIAIAVSCDPELVVADEATTALDVTTEREVIDLLRSLRERSGSSLLMVSHDLAVVAELCDRIVVFYAGEVVESGPVEQIVNDPRHPYTQALLRVASLGDGAHRALEVIPGQPPQVGAQLAGCRFADRCPHAHGGLHRRARSQLRPLERRARGPLRARRGARARADGGGRMSARPSVLQVRGLRVRYASARRLGGRRRAARRRPDACARARSSA